MYNKEIGFSVDAGLIQRLGYELVGRAETAVSELIKNSYDADATSVDVQFINPYQIGGTLVISDNGTGMNEYQLEFGFMRISSTDKVHNPISIKYGRPKAGRKGIGRFAAQRLGRKLTIITQTKDSDKAVKLLIDWEKYTIDCDLTSIKFPIEYVTKDKPEGTILIIDDLREKWTDASISRIFRYVSELFQPDYLSDRSKESNLAVQNESSFKVNFYQKVNDINIPILNDKKVFFDKALAIFEGHVGLDHKGSVTVKSTSLNIDDSLEIWDNDNNAEFSELSNVYFKIYYFIYNRSAYYGGGISSQDLKAIEELSKTASGIKLYRNGFRVLPYGEITNDWVNIDARWSSESGKTNVPLSNRNLFGFVEIIDPDGSTFEETASREGLIENDAFKQLSDFMHKSLVAVRSRIVEKITLIRSSQQQKENTDEDMQTAIDMFDELKSLFEKDEQNQSPQARSASERKIELLGQIRNKIEETGMLRVLAGLGLTIGEFTHEIKQFQPAINGSLAQLYQAELDKKNKLFLDNIKSDVSRLFSYTKYFSTTISQNTNREKQPIDILEVLNSFKETIKDDLNNNYIDFQIQPYTYTAQTVSMHPSEWVSILYNLYTNSKKAIRRKKAKGKILIQISEDNKYVILSFNDNGDGIPEENKTRVFNAFFSTSTPASFNAPYDEQLVGTGLGLKIVKDIITSYKGIIEVSNPAPEYNTCFTIKIPKQQ